VLSCSRGTADKCYIHCQEVLLFFHSCFWCELTEMSINLGNIVNMSRRKKLAKALHATPWALVIMLLKSVLKYPMLCFRFIDRRVIRILLISHIALQYVPFQWHLLLQSCCFLSTVVASFSLSFSELSLVGLVLDVVDKLLSFSAVSECVVS